MSTHPHTRLFTQVDRTNDPDFFVRFMDEEMRGVWERWKARQTAASLPAPSVVEPGA